MTNRRTWLAAAFLFTACGAFAQPAAPVFEVATIKPSQPMTPQLMMSGKAHLGMKVDAGHVEIGFWTISDMICAAYEIKSYQLTSPDYAGMAGQRFDIVAKMPEGATKEQVPAMLKALLADRFKLTLHKENKDHSIYALVVGKNGPKLKESPPDVAPPPVAEDEKKPADKKDDSITIGNGNSQMKMNQADGGRKVTVSGGENGKQTMVMGENGMMHMEIEKINMEKFAESLARFTGRPVVDETGLKGNYQVALDLSMADMMAAARAAGVAIPGGGPGGGAGAAPAEASDPSAGNSIFQSVQQMGLKLEAKKEPLDALVVDHVEKTPTEN